VLVAGILTLQNRLLDYPLNFSRPAQIMASVGLGNRMSARQDAKNAKLEIVSFFAAFASLREIFRASVAAMLR
jgi:hypothetical protein